MDVFLKFILSSTILVTINFVFKTLTSSNFDKLFIPKHQRALQTVCLFILLLFVFTAYGIFLAALYHEVEELEYTVIISGIILIMYLIGLVVIGVICLVKWWKDRKAGNQFVITERKANILTFSLIIINILVFAMILCDVIYVAGVDKIENWGNTITCIGEFFTISYLLLKAQMYLQGYKKKRWGYVLSPMPENVEKKYLNVLYSLTPTQLVLSEDGDNVKYPTNIYLYDLTKQSYIHFERVLLIKK